MQVSTLRRSGILLGFIFFSTLIIANPYSTNLYSFSNAVSGGGNVSSVTSGNNCIVIDPTTGNVIVTFNLSCSGTGGITLDEYKEWLRGRS